MLIVNGRQMTDAEWWKKLTLLLQGELKKIRKGDDQYRHQTRHIFVQPWIVMFLSCLCWVS